jgi:hypothetical protein
MDGYFVMVRPNKFAIVTILEWIQGDTISLIQGDMITTFGNVM